MTVENNRKYIAEAWIENGEDEEFKKSFLKSLLKQQQGHTRGFDADTVDGMHLYEIENEISEAVNGFIKSFNIGNTSISEGGITYYLGFEGIRLYNIEADGTPDEEKALPWSANPYTLETPYSEEKTVPSLYDVIVDLYNCLHVEDNNDYEGYSEQQLYNIFKQRMNSAESRLDSLDEKIGDKISADGRLDADSVNGIRFFIYNDEEYEDLEESAAGYDPTTDTGTEQQKNDYIKLHSINNVFIVKDKQELIDMGVDGGVYSENPDVAPISKYYQFDIITKNILNQQTGITTPEKWLVYKYEGEEQWKDICKTSDFIDDEAVKQSVINTLATNTNYVLNPDVVEASLNEIIITDSTTIPMVAYNRDTYIKGAVYDYIDNNSKTDVPIQTIDNFQFLNLTPFQNTFDEKVTQANSNLNEYKERLEGQNENGGILGGIKSDIQGVKTSLSSIKGTSTKSLSSLEESINKLTTSVNKLTTDVSNLNKWESANVSGLSYTSAGKTYQSVCIFNRALGIAMFYFSFNHYNLSGDNGWGYRQISSRSTDYNEVKAKPWSNVVFPCTDSPTTFVRIDTDGGVQVKCTSGTNGNRHILGHGMYKIGGYN